MYYYLKSPAVSKFGLSLVLLNPSTFNRVYIVRKGGILGWSRCSGCCYSHALLYCPLNIVHLSATWLASPSEHFSLERIIPCSLHSETENALCHYFYVSCCAAMLVMPNHTSHSQVAFGTSVTSFLSNIIVYLFIIFSLLPFSPFGQFLL